MKKKITVLLLAAVVNVTALGGCSTASAEAPDGAESSQAVSAPEEGSKSCCHNENDTQQSEKPDCCQKESEESTYIPDCCGE